MKELIFWVSTSTWIFFAAFNMGVENVDQDEVIHTVYCDTLFIPWFNPDSIEYRDKEIDVENKDRNRLHDHWKAARNPQAETR